MHGQMREILKPITHWILDRYLVQKDIQPMAFGNGDMDVLCNKDGQHQFFHCLFEMVGSVTIPGLKKRIGCAQIFASQPDMACDMQVSRM